MVPPETSNHCSLTNELNVQMNFASADLLISHERIDVLGFWDIGDQICAGFPEGVSLKWDHNCPLRANREILFSNYLFVKLGKF